MSDNTMKALADKQLVVKITGSVQSSNLVEFEKMAVAVVAGINTTLVTDQDFSIAEQDVKSCSLIETRLQQAKTDALNGTKEISDLVLTIDRLTESFRQTRLLLNGKVKTEKEKRVNEILAGAKNKLAEKVAISPAKHGFAIDHTSINFAVKGKKSLTKMQEAVDLVVAAEELRLITIEALYLTNLVKIEDADAEWPGLFHDKQNIALSATETVEALIVGRVADHRLKVAEKARKEKEEAERQDKLKADAIAATLAEDASARVNAKLVHHLDTGGNGTTIDLPIMPVKPFADLPIPPTGSFYKTYRIIATTRHDPAGIVEVTRQLIGVDSVTVEEV